MERGQRGKHLSYTETKIRIKSDFFSETTQEIKEWSEIFNVL